MNRIFLIVLDSFGIGVLPDGPAFGDRDVHTLRSCARTGLLRIPNLIQAGLGNIDGVDCIPATDRPSGAYGRLGEQSQGKDTTIGHWEIAGLISEQPLPTYPNGFPEEVLAPFRAATGRGVLANAPWSGTEVIQKFGDEHLRTGDLIVYTSADSVFQIAAHEDLVPVEELYRFCRIARDILRGKHGVGRVIARPFTGTSGHFTRTANRHDFSLEPPAPTLLDRVQQAGLSTIALGKIRDIFAGRGITDYQYQASNAEGMAHALEWAARDFRGLCFLNLVDFDMLYGHRRDPAGYARALNEFDAWLPHLLQALRPGDLVMITADHGCDPGYSTTTDHTREYVPLLMLGPDVTPCNLGTGDTFAHIAATVADLLGVAAPAAGTSFRKK